MFYIYFKRLKIVFFIPISCPCIKATTTVVIFWDQGMKTLNSILVQLDIWMRFQKGSQFRYCLKVGAWAVLGLRTFQSHISADIKVKSVHPRISPGIQWHTACVNSWYQGLIYFPCLPYIPLVWITRSSAKYSLKNINFQEEKKAVQEKIVCNAISRVNQKR